MVGQGTGTVRGRVPVGIRHSVCLIRDGHSETLLRRLTLVTFERVKSNLGVQHSDRVQRSIGRQHKSVTDVDQLAAGYADISFHRLLRENEVTIGVVILGGTPIASGPTGAVVPLHLHVRQGTLQQA